jgi:hypothetical protein
MESSTLLPKIHKEHVAGDVQDAAVHEHRAEDRQDRRRVVTGDVTAADRGAALDDDALLPRVRDLVRDGPVVDDPAVGGSAEDTALLQDEVHEHVDRDQRDRDVRRPLGRDVVLEREHGVSAPTLPRPAARHRWIYAGRAI